MQLLSGKIAATRISGILHPKYQVHGFSVHLTAHQIFSLDAAGRIDFGGNEYIPAGRTVIAPHSLRPEDNYKWWELPRGTYYVECNETLNLAADEIALVEPEDRLLRAGGWHVPLFVRRNVAPVELLLEVGVAKLCMKENARFARIRLFLMEKSKSTADKSRKVGSRKPSPVMRKK
jgi:deoxycytidine triphosphate deaminase